ncbi:helix-turn-helix transcriptional regulator [Nocardioides sp. Root190]|uniref:helix-turn-helix transcriptional regulator n=1 Tax=Nocardioides sp. Root190 TaxID=1736488 RepID=UPI00138F5920|nr:helix-turn-helix transcriptional regulator [Nocardioides sp. Root190]
MPAHSSLTMVGRDTELAEATSVLADAISAAGSGTAHRSVLLSGDAGVGKTRLLRALRDHALAEGWQVLAGHCLDFGDSALPYLPFSEVLGRLGNEHPELVEAVAAVHPALTRLQPGRRTRLVGDDGSGEPGHATDRGDTFVAVHALLETAATEAPVLLIVEDLHWADQSTREMLGFLFTRAFARPVAIVGSYRSDDLHRRHPLRRQVAEWSRLPQVGRLALGPLQEAAVRALVDELSPDALDERSVNRIVSRAEGNAFFVEELVASDPGADDDVPGDLADLLLVRLDRLSDHARHVVRVGCVAGRRISHDLLAATADLPVDEFEAGVRQAIEMNVLEASGHRYAFRHALLGEAVYDDLLPGERVRLHARFVAALLDGSALGTAAELAYHARRGNDLDRALSASVEAGDEAMAVGGPDEAAHHYEQALELLEDPERAQRLGLDHAKLVVKAATALTTGGDTLRAAHLLAHQVDRLPADAPATARARLLSEHAYLLCIIETDLDPGAVSAEAVALAPEGESPLRAKVLATHARVLANLSREDEAEGFATEALGLAERLAMPVLVSEVVTTLSSLRVKRVDGSEQEALRAALETAVERAAEAGAFQAEVRGRFLLGRSHQDSGEWEAATRWFRSSVDCGQRAGLPWAPYIIESRWQLTLVQHLLGEWDDVLRLTDVVDDVSGPVIPRGIVEPVRLAVLGARGEDVIDRVRRLRTLWADEGGVAVHSAGVEIELLGARGEATAAIAVYDDVVEVVSRIWQERFAARIRLAAQTLGAIARALPAASAAERRSLAERAERLRADGDTVVAWFRENGGPWGPEGRFWDVRLTAEHLRVRWLAGTGANDREELLAAWATTVDAATKFGHVPEEARVRAAHSQILRLTGDPARAREEADAARAIADRLAAPALVLLDALDPRVPEVRPASSRHGAPAEAGAAALTAREVEILTLVAEGRSNGEIGKQLFISTKTVSVHVSNILGKLGAASRTEAAAIAHRDDLLPQG